MYFQVKFVNRTEQNRTEQNRTGLPSVAEQNYYKAYFIAKENLAKFISVVYRAIISYTKQNIIFNYFKIFYAIF